MSAYVDHSVRGCVFSTRARRLSLSFSLSPSSDPPFGFIPDGSLFGRIQTERNRRDYFTTLRAIPFVHTLFVAALYTLCPATSNRLVQSIATRRIVKLEAKTAIECRSKVW